MVQPPRFFKSRCPTDNTVTGSVSRKTTMGFPLPGATVIDRTKAPCPEMLSVNSVEPSGVSHPMTSVLPAIFTTTPLAGS
jgi:hypothetical protein